MFKDIINKKILLNYFKVKTSIIHFIFNLTFKDNSTVIF